VPGVSGVRDPIEISIESFDIEPKRARSLA
jgi:hypothetical protein